MEKIAGGCLCGKVRVIASGSPSRVGICHCLDCRKHHGALFYAAAIFPENQVTIEGETSHYAGRYECWTVRRESWLPQFPLEKRYDRDGRIEDLVED